MGFCSGIPGPLQPITILKREYMDPRVELEKILHTVGPDNIWRPIVDVNNEPIVDGMGDMREGDPRDLAKVDFKGKNVLDIGCNFGYYSFLARDLGAGRVTGIDIDGRAIRGCRLLKDMYGADNVEFIEDDFTTANLAGPYDIGMLISFFGKEMIKIGIHPYLEAVERLSRDVMIISVRLFYRVSKHLGGDPDVVLRHYPASYLQGDHFRLIDFVTDFYKERWNVSVISPESEDTGLKRTVLFVRK